MLLNLLFEYFVYFYFWRVLNIIFIRRKYKYGYNGIMCVSKNMEGDGMFEIIK